jgi:putative DNA primase/helicase
VSEDLSRDLITDPSLLAAAEADDAPSEAAELDRLAALPRMEYDRARREAAEQLGIRVVILDDEVSRRRSDGEDASEFLQGTAVEIADPEPWRDEVCGSDLANELFAVVRQHVRMSKESAVAAVLWILHTHAHEASSISPILAITSPVPACGKTTLLSLLNGFCPRSMTASNITTAALFRSVEKWKPTLLIDEADTFLKRSDELRGTLNSGHNRTNAYVARTSGDDHEPRLFSTWGPKAIALIGKLPDTLVSRSIEIPMRRLAPGESVEELRADRMQHLEPLRRQAWRWAQDHLEDLRSANPLMPEGMRGRAADNWRPLLAIADELDDLWPERARKTAHALSGREEEQPKGILLLADVEAIFKTRKVDRITSSDLAAELARMEDRPWPEWRDGKPITKRQVASLLKPFDIQPKSIRIDSQTAKGYLLDQFQDSFGRYLADRSVTASQTLQTLPFEVDGTVTGSLSVTDQDESKTLQTGGCDGVTDQHANSGAASQVEVEL